MERRGLPVYDAVPDAAPFARGAGTRLEEKLAAPTDTIAVFCQEHLTAEEAEMLCGREVLLPISLDPEIWLPIPADSPHESMIAGAPQVLPLAARLAAILEPPVGVPVTSDNLDLTFWFMYGPARELASRRPGPWSAGLDAAFYLALRLRAAQHSLRRSCPPMCS